MKSNVTSRRNLLLVAAAVLLIGLVLAACSSPTPEPTPVPPTPEPTAVVEVGWSVPDEFAEGTFPPPLSKIDEHENPWQIRDCFTCHDKQTGGATENRRRRRRPTREEASQ